MTTTADRTAAGTTAPGHAALRDQGTHLRQVGDDDRPQGHRQPLLHHLVPVVHARRVMALIIRAELVSPGLQVVDTKEQFNQLFTMHGTIMLLLFATPLFAAFANALMPLHIGAPDVAFPRLNMFAYWLYLFGGLIAAGGFLTPQGAASFGWFAYAPLSDQSYSPGLGGDLWVFGLALAGFGTILGAVNFITTIVCMRAPGMTMFRMPIFTWTVLIPRSSSWVFPILAAALLALGGDRRFGHAHLRPGERRADAVAAPVLVLRASRGVHHRAAVLRHHQRDPPVFAPKPLFGYKTLVFATIAIAALSTSVWAHHMYATGQVLLPFFAVMTMLIAVPTGREVLQLDRHDVGRQGLDGHADALGDGLPRDVPLRWPDRVILASPALDFHLSDSYFVVATSTTPSSAPSCSRCSPGSTSGGRS